MKKDLPFLSPGQLAALIDLVMVNVAFVAAYWLRYDLQLGPEVLDENVVPLSDYTFIQGIFTVCLMAVFASSGLYSSARSSSVFDQMTKILGGTSLGVMLTLAGVFFTQGWGYSRLLFVFAWVLVVVLLLLARAVWRLVESYLTRRGIGVRRVLVVGKGQPAHVVMHVIATEPRIPYQLVGFVSDQPNGNLGRFPCLGNMADLARVVTEHQVNEVIVALPGEQHRDIMRVMRLCHRDGLEFRVVPDVFELSLNRVDVNHLRGVPLIGIKKDNIHGTNYLIKRLLDVAGAGLLLILLSLVWAVIAIAIKLDSPGPVFFRQKRIGRWGKPFMALKFRSMRTGAEDEQARLVDKNEATGPLFKMRRDPRVTRVGRCLRRTSLDETPQLINVLRGEMSLVGPRPGLPSEVADYEDWHRRRLDAAPGLTGLWQVSGRSELPFDEMVLMDVYYLENWSLGQDIKILLRTLPAVISGRGAY